MPVPPGTRLGPYEILAPIGVGGMGEVYRARDLRLDRLVALKVLPESFAADADRLRRFEIEAKAAGALNHPNILVVHDIGTDKGFPYLVSELLEGESLRERLKKGKLGPTRAIEMARQIVAGLAAAHGKAIVHLDLKPGNLFVTRDGRVKILDFGLAKVTVSKAADGATQTLETDPGTIVGTMAYMSPEQVRGQEVDPRSDIFSFGCVLYEMLIGERAFHGPTAADTMSAILHADPLESLPAGAAIPPALARTIRHCLEKDVEERFQSAKDLTFELEAASTTSAPAIAAGTSPAPLSRKRVPLWAAAFCLAIAAAAVWWGSGRSRVSAPVFQRLTFRRGILQAARFAPDRRTVIYAAAWGGDRLQVFTTQPGQPESRAIGDRATGLFGISPSGEIAIAVAVRFQGAFNVGGTLAQIPLNGGAPRELLDDVMFADWAPDGKQLAVVIGRSGPSEKRLEFPPGHVLMRSSNTAWPGDIRVSPKGDRIAFADHYYYGDDGSVAIIDLRGARKTISSQYTSLQGLAWSPDGKEVWFTGAKKGGQRCLYAATMSGKERQVLGVPGMATLRDISKDGRVLLSRDESRIEVEFVGPGADRPRDLSWLDWTSVNDISADGSMLALTESGDGVAGGHVVYFRKVDGSPAVRLGEDADGKTFSPDGTWLLTTNDLDARKTGVTLLPLRAGVAVRIETGMLIRGGVGWFPDGKRIAYTAGMNNTSRVFVQEIGGSPRPVTPEGVRLLGVSPDGAQLLVRNSGGHALYPAAGGSPVPVSALGQADQVCGFAEGGKAVYVTLPYNGRVERVDLGSGRRELWRELHPSDPAGVRSFGPVRLSRDGKAIAYTVYRTVSELYLADRLK
jgi:Tol biopolymer transport system component